MTTVGGASFTGGGRIETMHLTAKLNVLVNGSRVRGFLRELVGMRRVKDASSPDV